MTFDVAIGPQRRRLVRIFLCGLLLVASGCGTATTAVSTGGDPPGLGALMAPSIGLAEIGDLSRSDDGARGVPVASPGRVLFSRSPIAIQLPDGSVVYNSWQRHREVDRSQAPSEQGLRPGDAVGRPSIRLVDPTSGADDLLVDGAQSLAVSQVGQVAYARGIAPDYRHDMPWPNEVVVQDAIRGRATVWSTGQDTDEHTVLAWAADRLIVERRGGPDPSTRSLLAFEGPGKVQELATGLDFLAVSPDGEHLLVGTGDRWLSDGTWELQLLEVATGEVRGLGDVTGGTMAFGASWAGDTIVVGGSAYGEGPGEHPRIVVLHATTDGAGWHITREALITVDGDRAMSPGDAWLAADRSRVVAVGTPPLPRQAGRVQTRPRVLIQCSTATGDCSYDELPVMSDEQVGRVANPSRPAGEDLSVERS